MMEFEGGVPYHELHRDEAYEALRGKYFDYEPIDRSLLESFLREGEVRNMHLIEELGQPMSPHKDKVLTGEMTTHKDRVMEGELFLPNIEKPLLVVYKPDSGVNKGTYQQKRDLQLPPGVSRGSNKEEGAWILTRELGFSHLMEPVVKRELEEGMGSVRPYIWGKPVDLLGDEEFDQFYNNTEAIEDIAYIDSYLQPLDRKDPNMLMTTDGRHKLIDNTLTFWDRKFVRKEWIQGPRLAVAYDGKNPSLPLKQTPLPERLKERTAYAMERRDEIAQALLTTLTEPEVDDFIKHTENLHKTGIFL